MTTFSRSDKERSRNWKRRTWIGCHVIAITACLMLAMAPNVMGVGAPIIAPGVDFNVDASLDTDGDSRAEDSVGASGFDLNLDNSPAVTRVVTASSRAGITHAYSFPGGSTGNEAGALLSTAGTSTTRSFQNAPGDWTNEDVSIEIWFKPDSLVHTPANGQILFEDGGGNGFGFFLNDNLLQLREQGGGDIVSFDVSGISGDFIQAVGTYARNGGANDQIELFVNGTSVGTDANNNQNDWSGGDPAAVGTRGGANTGGIGGGQSSTESFDGEIAIFRVYRNDVLSAAEVLTNFNAVNNEAPIAQASGLLNYDASEDDGANSTFENTGTFPGFNITGLAGETFDTNPPPNTPHGIKAVYAFDGAGSGGNLPSLEGLDGGQADESNVSFELWFRPSDLSGDEVLFETGGGNGVGIFLGGGTNGTFSGVSDSEVTFSVTQNSLGSQTAFVSADLAGLDPDDFIQLVGTFDIVSDTATLYINGMLIGDDVATANITDWTGSDAAALGQIGGANMGGIAGGAQGFTNFEGEVGIFRVYTGQVLTANEVFERFRTVNPIPEPTTAALCVLGVAGLAGRRRRRA